MKIIILTSAILSIGCANLPDSEIIPDHINPVPPNVADAEEPWDGSKGKFPPGRVIDYKGHGIGYNGYHVDEFHRKYYKENGISPH